MFQFHQLLLHAIRTHLRHYSSVPLLNCSGTQRNWMSMGFVFGFDETLAIRSMGNEAADSNRLPRFMQRSLSHTFIRDGHLFLRSELRIENLLMRMKRRKNRASSKIGWCQSIKQVKQMIDSFVSKWILKAVELMDDEDHI